MVRDFFHALLTPERPQNIGDVRIEWTYPEFIKYDRSKPWYIMAGIIVVALIVYSIITMNFLFAVIVLLFTFIAVFQSFQKPRTLKVKITDLGILLERKFYFYKELEGFWFVYEPPVVKNLYIDFKGKLKRNLIIPLEDANPLKVRELLEQNLIEDLEKDSESFAEIFSRLIKY